MRNSLVYLFLDLIQIDSPTGQEEKVREYIHAFLEKRNIQSAVDEHGNLLAKVSGSGIPLLLSAHMDTVEPGRGIKPHITKDGYIVSDGTTILGGDNKVGIAVILHALDTIGDTQHRPLELLFTVAEESGISGASRFDYIKLSSKEGYCFDLTQPLGTIVSAAPFYEHFEIMFTGQSAHASRPHLGKNVLPAVSKLLTQLSYGKIDDETFFNIGVVTLGDAINTIPGNAKLVGEIRSFTQASLEKSINFCKKKCEEIMQEFGITIESTWVLENPGYKHVSSKAKDFISRTAKYIEKVGLTASLQEVGGISDANEFNAHGVLALELSTGGENAHTREERVKVADLGKLADLVLALVEN